MSLTHDVETGVNQSWQNFPIFYRPDTSFVITVADDEGNQLPFHVPNEGEFTYLWMAVDIFTRANPQTLQPEPTPPPPTEEELLQEQINAITMQLTQIDEQSRRPMRQLKVAELRGEQIPQEIAAELKTLDDQAQALIDDLESLTDYQTLLAMPDVA